jgi:hypothetical protein
MGVRIGSNKPLKSCAITNTSMIVRELERIDATMTLISNKLCHNADKSLSLVGVGMWSSPFESEYATNEEYTVPPMANTSPIPIPPHHQQLRRLLLPIQAWRICLLCLQFLDWLSTLLWMMRMRLMVSSWLAIGGFWRCEC